MKTIVKSVISRTLAVDNSADEARKYNISAQVTVDGERIRSITSGIVDDGEGHKVTFQSYAGTDNMRIEFNNAADRQGIVGTIDALIADIEANISQLMPGVES